MYLCTQPERPTFVQKGLKGFRFALNNKKVEIYFVNVEKGHDTFIVSKKITDMYYVIDGSGFFIIENRRYDVKPGIVVEVPPNVEYTYSGTMKLLLILTEPWFEGNEQVTKNNPDVELLKNA
jgi:mannose-6-phosphate isomerase-like protein (cupin superfamily)